MKSIRTALATAALTMRLHGILYIAVLSMLVSDYCVAQNSSLQTRLQAVMNDPVKPLASLSVVAIRDGKMVYQGYFGKRTIDPGVAVDGKTLFRVASISKLVTTLGVMQLVEQHKINLDADVSTYLGFRLRNPNFPEALISTRMLLNHTSSLRDDGGYSFPIGQSLQSVLDPRGENYGAGGRWALPSSSADRSPGRYFEYVNLNWGVLGTVIEAVSGQRFDSYMKQAVLAPLKIAGGFNVEELSEDEIGNLAVLYRKRNGEVWDSTGPWVSQVDDYQGKVPAVRAGLERYRLGRNATPFSPQGGLRIRAGDLAKVMLLLINGGELDGVRLLSTASVQAMLSETWRHDEKTGNGDNYKGLFNAWGLGVQKFLDLSASGRGDRLVARGGLSGY
ncbi:MAG: serine hydrolase, partial [Comamonadaceae bacterium]